MRTLPPDRSASACRDAASAGGCTSKADSAAMSSPRTERLEPDHLAARADGRQQSCPANARSGTKTVRDGGSSRFFSSALAALRVHVVGRIDDHHPVAAIMRRSSTGSARTAPDLVDR